MDDVCGMRNILKIRDLVRNGPEVSVAHFVLLARPGNMEIANSGIYDIFDSVIRKPLKFRQFMDGIRKARTGEPLSAVYPEDDSLTAEKYPMKILFAEDQKINREIVSAMMKLLGYSPDCVGSGTDVLKKIREKKYDMLFIDKSLPELDGLETARAVVCQYPEIRPRIVMITGDGSEEARLRAFSTGVDEYMLKPVAFENLKSMIESFGKKISDNSCPEIDTKYREIPYIDFKLIERHLVLGEDIVVELLKVFLNDTPERLRKISNLVFRGNYREIRDEAHALKGAAASIGASRLAEDCGMIQDACDEGKFTGLDKLSMKATETFKETNRFLENYKRFNL
jgi:CheY-like chemotaxis protein